MQCWEQRCAMLGIVRALQIWSGFFSSIGWIFSSHAPSRQEARTVYQLPNLPCAQRCCWVRNHIAIWNLDSRRSVRRSPQRGQTGRDSTRTKCLRYGRLTISHHCWRGYPSKARRRRQTGEMAHLARAGQRIVAGKKAKIDKPTGWKKWLEHVRIGATSEKTGDESDGAYPSEIIQSARSALSAMEAIEPCKPPKAGYAVSL